MDHRANVPASPQLAAQVLERVTSIRAASERSQRLVSHHVRTLRHTSASAVPRPAQLGRTLSERAKLERRARLLAWAGIGWHVGEFVLWLFTGNGRSSHIADRRAEQLVAASFFLLATYISVEAIRALTKSVHPNPSCLGIGPAGVTAATMPILAGTKRRTGKRLHAA